MKRTVILILSVAHILLLVMAGFAFKTKSLEAFLPLDLREKQFAPYVTKRDCPVEFQYFQYCLRFGDKIDTIVLGDSSILAVAESGVYSNTLFLGAGSCPILTGLVTSFATPSCSTITNMFYNGEGWSLFNGSRQLILLHRSEYLREDSPRSYVNKLNTSIEFFKLVGIEKVVIELEVGRLNTPPATCLRMAAWKGDECAPSQTSEMLIRKELISEIQSSLVVIRQLKFDFLSYKDFKDEVHLTGKAYKSLLSEKYFE